MDNLASKWIKSLDKSLEYYNKFGTSLKEWDDSLTENGEKLLEVQSSMKETHESCNKIGQSLKYMDMQADDLDIFMDKVDAQLDHFLKDLKTKQINAGIDITTNNQASSNSMTASSSNNMNENASIEQKRWNVYETSLSLKDDLSVLTNNVISMADEISALNENLNKSMNIGISNDSGNQLLKVLRSHSDALNVLENKSNALSSTLESVYK